jgi:hypothetical protein
MTSFPKKILSIAMFFVFFLNYSFMAFAASYTWAEQDKVDADDDKGVNEEFGTAVALYHDTANDDTYLAVGIPEEQAAYVFIRESGNTTWTEQARLTPSSTDAGDGFGESIDIHGNHVIVGSPYYQQDDGRIHIYERTGTSWAVEYDNGGTVTTDNDLFGWSVAIYNGDDTYAAIGMPGDGSDEGRVDLYEHASGTWAKSSMQTTSDGAVNDFFGHSVDINNDVMIGGAPAGETVYIFDKAGWDANGTEDQKITASDGEDGDKYGMSVALDAQNEHAIVAASEYDISGKTDVGAVYILDESAGTWSENSAGAINLGAAAVASDKLGDRWSNTDSVSSHTVGIFADGSDNYAVVSGWNRDSANGELFYVEKDGGSWGSLSEVTPDTSYTAGEKFSLAVAIDSVYIAAGISLEDVSGTSNAGAVALFKGTIAANGVPEFGSTLVYISSLLLCFTFMYWKGGFPQAQGIRL